jgi:3-dehydroquinate synthase
MLDAAHFEWLADRADAILAREPAVLERLVTDSVRIKAAIVARDALEAGERALLNFGHTLGHGIEAAGGYRVPHGHAVAIGMALETRVGEAAGITAAGTAARIGRLLAAFGLPVARPDDLALDAILAAARTDKKARAGAVRFALPRALGEPARAADGAWTHAVADAAVRAALEGS